MIKAKRLSIILIMFSLLFVGITAFPENQTYAASKVEAPDGMVFYEICFESAVVYTAKPDKASGCEIFVDGKYYATSRVRCRSEKYYKKRSSLFFLRRGIFIWEKVMRKAFSWI